MNKKKKIIILLVAAVAILAIAVAILFFVFSGDDPTSVEPHSSLEPIDTQQYFSENSEIISVINVLESKDVKSEKEAHKLMKERGFTSNPLETMFSLEGDYIDTIEVDGSSTQKHPAYSTIYLSKQNVYWTIELINGSISASPIAYANGADEIPAVILVETDTVMSYDPVTDKFFETIPKKEVLEMVKIENVNASSLDEYKLKG